MRNRERGVTLPLTALFLVVLFVFAAMAIDMGIAYTARTSAQHAADAAALAGAYTFGNPTASQPSAAQSTAIVMAAQSKILGAPVTISAADVAVDTANQRVTVTVPRTGSNGIETFFARAFGWQKMNVVARATAEFSTQAAGSHCVKPFFLPNTVLSQQDPVTACNSKQVIFDQGQLTTFVENKWGAQLNLRPITPGGALAPSQFYSIQLGGPGAATYQCQISQCLNTCPTAIDTVQCGVGYPLQTGNMAGPTTAGVQQLIGPNPDTWISDGQYETWDGQYVDDSRSIIAVPIWDNCTQSISSGNGQQTLNVVGFVDLFVDGISGQTVTAHLVTAAACSTSPGSGPSNSTGPYAIPIRLIQTQSP
jgi:Flp pilus assembly protein TadG